MQIKNFFIFLWILLEPIHNDKRVLFQPFFHFLLYTSWMKNWEFDKETPQIIWMRRAAVFIDTERGADEKSEG